MNTSTPLKPRPPPGQQGSTPFRSAETPRDRFNLSLIENVSNNILSHQWNQRFVFDTLVFRLLTKSIQPACPVCHLALTIDLEAPALELEDNVPNARQGIIGRLNLETWRSSTKIEARLSLFSLKARQTLYSYSARVQP